MLSAPADAATARVAARLEEAERHARQGDIATTIRLVESLASERRPRIFATPRNTASPVATSP